MPAINERQIRLCVGHKVKCAKFESQKIQLENVKKKSRIIIRSLLLMILVIDYSTLSFSAHLFILPGRNSVLNMSVTLLQMLAQFVKKDMTFSLAYHLQQCCII
jgi:hypothetical protein